MEDDTEKAVTTDTSTDAMAISSDETDTFAGVRATDDESPWMTRVSDPKPVPVIRSPSILTTVEVPETVANDTNEVTS